MSLRVLAFVSLNLLSGTPLQHTAKQRQPNIKIIFLLKECLAKLFRVKQAKYADII